MLSPWFFFILFTLCLVDVSPSSGIPLPQSPECLAPGFNGTTQNRICNPSGYLDDDGIVKLRDKITIYEDTIVLCRGQPIQLQLGVFLEASIPTDVSSAQARAQQIHNSWGVGYKTPCGGSGLLLYLAINDHQIYISRGKALKGTLPNDILKAVTNDMKPWLRAGEWDQAVLTAVTQLNEYARGERLPPPPPPNPNSTFGWCSSWGSTFFGCLSELFVGMVSFFGSVFLLCGTCFGCSWCCHRLGFITAYRADSLEGFQEKLARMEDDRDLAEAGNYRATSCPICLELFQYSTNEENPAPTVPIPEAQVEIGGDSTVDETTPLVMSRRDKKRMGSSTARGWLDWVYVIGGR